MLVLLAEKVTTNLLDIDTYDQNFGVGEFGELHIMCSESLGLWQVDEINGLLSESGVDLTVPVIQDARILFFKFKQTGGVGALQNIAAAMASSNPVPVILGWQIFKERNSNNAWLWVAGGAVGAAFLLWNHKRVSTR